MAERKSQRAADKGPGLISASDVSRGRPEVIVEFLFDGGLLCISVKNIGEKPAVNVSVRFSKKLMGLGGTREISALALFKNIEFLGPGREIVALLDSGSSYFRRKQPTKVSALIAYGDLEKRSYELTIKHDLEIYRELPFVSHSAKTNLE